MKKQEGYWLEFEAEIEVDGQYKDVTIEARGKAWRELYGADADGNRGVMADDAEVYEMKVFDENCENIIAALPVVEVDCLIEEAEETFIKDFYAEVCDE